jgi:hypothetical protein
MPKLVREARFPGCVNVITGLQNRAKPSRPTAVNESKVAAVGSRPQF